jgi:hypothetical protein
MKFALNTPDILWGVLASCGNNTPRHSFLVLARNVLQISYTYRINVAFVITTAFRGYGSMKTVVLSENIDPEYKNWRD